MQFGTVAVPLNLGIRLRKGSKGNKLLEQFKRAIIGGTKRM